MSHVRCQVEFPKFRTFSPSEISSHKSAQFRIACTQQTPSQIHLPQRNDHRDHQTAIGEAHYGFNSPSPDSTIAAPPKRPQRGVDVKNYQHPPESIVETVQNIAEQQPAETNIFPVIGEVSPLATRDPALHEIDTPTLAHSMTVFEAEGHNLNEWDN